MNRTQLDPGIVDPEPDPLAPARGIALGTAIGCALWVLVFAGLAVLVALLTGGKGA